MVKYLLDEDGKLLKASIPSGGSVPEGYQDISKDIQFDEDISDLDTGFLEAEEIPAVQAVEFEAEHWTDGTFKAYAVDDIPTLIDGNGNPYPNPNFINVPMTPAVEFVPAYYNIKKKSSADQSLREEKMSQIRESREDLLKEADIEINKLEDSNTDSSTWRTYRQALRDVTATHKKAGGDWKVSVDSLDAANFVFPSKPE
jgi:hypothetical protein